MYNSLVTKDAQCQTNPEVEVEVEEAGAERHRPVVQRRLKRLAKPRNLLVAGVVLAGLLICLWMIESRLRPELIQPSFQ